MSKYRIKKDYLNIDLPPYVQGASRRWVISNKDLIVSNPPEEEVVLPCIKEADIKKEFIDIGITGFFEEVKNKKNSSDGNSGNSSATTD